MRKLDRILRNYVKHNPYEEVNDKMVYELAILYFSKYQDDTIERDIKETNRFQENVAEYNDIDKDDDLCFVCDDELFEYVKRIIRSKLETKNFW